MDLNKRDFIRVIDANQRLIKSLCCAYYASGDDQKDAFQDILLQLWKSFDSFKGESAISTWIYRVSLNTLLAKVRKEKNQIVTESISDASLVLNDAMADDEVGLLNIVLQSLRGVDKAIVILYLEGYKNREIAQILDLTATNISTRLNRIKADLKQRFKEHHHELK